jgi:hypothetical protein
MLLKKLLKIAGVTIVFAPVALGLVGGSTPRAFAECDGNVPPPPGLTSGCNPTPTPTPVP